MIIDLVLSFKFDHRSLIRCANQFAALSLSVAGFASSRRTRHDLRLIGLASRAELSAHAVDELTALLVGAGGPGMAELRQCHVVGWVALTGL